MAGLQPDIYAAISITWVAAFLALGLRLKARRMTKMNLWFDDYFAVIALLFVSSYCSVTIYWTHNYKLGQSILTIEDTIEANRIQDRSRLLLWICELLYASSIAFCKLSILCFYWRVFQYTSIRYAIIILLIAVSIWITIRTFMVIFHCVPIRAYWDKSIQGAKCPFNEANFFFATILIHTTMDCVILILPVIEVMKMTLPLSQKLAVVGLFTSGTMYVELLFVICWSNAVQKHDVGSRRDKYGSFLRLSPYATTHFSSLSSRTLDDGRVSPSADQFTKRYSTGGKARGNEIKETGVSEVRHVSWAI
ncbi:hypothetical protein BFJ70_g4427 [Fusarium oxysporum]|nr:hypothetical protein BFJ70_g4427 [Fusarium oxysporum]